MHFRSLQRRLGKIYILSVSIDVKLPRKGVNLFVISDFPTELSVIWSNSPFTYNSRSHANQAQSNKYSSIKNKHKIRTKTRFPVYLLSLQLSVNFKASVVRTMMCLKSSPYKSVYLRSNTTAKSRAYHVRLHCTRKPGTYKTSPAVGLAVPFCAPKCLCFHNYGTFL